MLIRFEVDGEPVEFHRSWLTGRAQLRLRDKVVPLQYPLNPLTHFSVTLARVWTHPVGEHQVTIEKVRPLLLAGLLPHDYRVLVDDRVVAERRGY